ncbi:MAG: hypothetical protein H0Z37_08030 [Firmicutes bacterium]|nr:hypothetical protein [Bacillota bacterium]
MNRAGMNRRRRAPVAWKAGAQALVARAAPLVCWAFIVSGALIVPGLFVPAAAGAAPYAAVPAAFSGNPPALPGPDGTALLLGIHVGDEPEYAALFMPVAAGLGASVVPVEFRWDKVEAVPGRFSWDGYDRAVRSAVAFGLKPVGVLVYPRDVPWLGETGGGVGWPSGYIDDWLYFAGQVVARYGWIVTDWILWREEPLNPNPFLYASEAVPHARWTQDTAAVIRRIRPAARVRAAVPGADLRWLEVFAAAEGLSAVDGLVLDLNRWPAPPDGLPVAVDEVRAVARAAGSDPELWVWRWGYPTHDGISTSPPRRRGVGEQEQAAFAVQSHILLAAAGVRAVLAFEAIDRGMDPSDASDRFGLFRSDGSAKPAAAAYQTMAKTLAGLVSSGRVEPGAAELGAGTLEDAVAAELIRRAAAAAEPKRFEAYRFVGDGGRQVLVVWVAGGRGTPGTSPAAGAGGEGGMRVSLAGFALPGVAVRVTGPAGDALEELPLGPAPVYVEIRPAPAPDPLPEEQQESGDSSGERPRSRGPASGDRNPATRGWRASGGGISIKAGEGRK